MSRLLFAAARGARIQRLETGAVWVDADNVPIDEYNTLYCHRRIHPDDEHLQYGPISTALRGLGLVGAIGVLESDWEYAARDMYYREVPDNQRPADIDHRSLFLLILAEALADEGL